MPMRAKVLVTLRSGVLDPAGQAVAGNLQELGFHEVQDVRIGKVIEVELDDDLRKEAARDKLDAMARKLLANLVIEDFRIEID
jgi:phosphoribosylformylglycinamidine synthase